MAETDDAPALTRAERRALERGARLGAAPTRPASGVPPLPPLAGVRRPLAVLATVAASLVIALTGFAHPYLALVSYVFVGLVMAWGWAQLVSMPSPRGSTAVLAVTVLACGPAAVLDNDLPFLGWLPAGVAIGILAMLVHQLLRFDGRPRLTDTLAGAALGIAVLASGSMYAALPLAEGGEGPLAVALVAIAASSLLDLLAPRVALRAWLLPLAMVVGAGAAFGLSTLDRSPAATQAVLLGLLAAGVSHALRRMLTVLPTMAGSRAQLSAGAASVLVCGVVVYVTPSLVAVVAYLWELVHR